MSNLDYRFEDWKRKNFNVFQILSWFEDSKNERERTKKGDRDRKSDRRKTRGNRDKGQRGKCKSFWGQNEIVELALSRRIWRNFNLARKNSVQIRTYQGSRADFQRPPLYIRSNGSRRSRHFSLSTLPAENIATPFRRNTLRSTAILFYLRTHHPTKSRRRRFQVRLRNRKHKL